MTTVRETLCALMLAAVMAGAAHAISVFVAIIAFLGLAFAWFIAWAFDPETARREEFKHPWEWWR